MGVQEEDMGVEEEFVKLLPCDWFTGLLSNPIQLKPKTRVTSPEPNKLTQKCNKNMLVKNLTIENNITYMFCY